MELQVIFTVNYFLFIVSTTINKKISGRKCCVRSMITLIPKTVLYITLIRGANCEAPRIYFIVILNVVIHLIPHIIYNIKDAASHLSHITEKLKVSSVIFALI